MDVDHSIQMPQGEPAHALQYDGRVGEIYPIFLMNLLLTIVTFGIFRFWAITRMRRYVWSRTSFQGQRLNYTGRGGELFVGFMLAGVVLGALGATAVGLAELLKRVDEQLAVVPFLVLYLVILVLALGAPYSAQRYRLSRTEWCGIRGGMRGSMLAYGLRSLLYWLLTPLTMFQLIPWVQLRLTERRINASSLGSAQFSAQFSAGRVYGRFLVAIIGTVLLAGVIGGVGWTIAGPMLAEQQRYLQAMHGHPPDGPASNMAIQLIILLVTAELTFFLGAAMIGAAYQALMLRHMADNTALGPVQLSGRFTALGLLWLVVGNLLITVFTLGFGYPFALQRYARYVTGNLCATGSLDPATLSQSEQRAPRFGEGMFQQLDAGGGIF
ncbi:MAG TPA: YjgN family protein [Acidisphaera sp.]|nr:YjgN family protein [Acidisphaera sp.]